MRNIEINGIGYSKKILMYLIPVHLFTAFVIVLTFWIGYVPETLSTLNFMWLMAGILQHCCLGIALYLFRNALLDRSKSVTSWLTFYTCLAAFSFAGAVYWHIPGMELLILFDMIAEVIILLAATASFAMRVIAS